MPQLDSVTFFTQFFWTILSVFVFHFCISKWIVPAFSRAQKSRSKVATLNSKSSLSDTTSTLQGLRSSSSDSSLPKQSFGLQNEALHDHSPRESTLTLLRQVLSLSFQTLLLGKNVETKFYKNRVQDMYANTNVFGLPKKQKKITQLNKMGTLVEKQFKYVDSVLRTDLSKTTASSEKSKYVQKGYAIQMDDNLLSRRTQLFTTLRNVRQKVAHKVEKEWIPHGILNMGRVYLQSPKPGKREQVSNSLVFSSNGRGCTWSMPNKVKITSSSQSSDDDMNKKKNKVEQNKAFLNKDSKSKSKKIQTPKNKK